MAAERVIINSDDLGLCSSVDAGILEAWERGAISDSTVFATSPHLSVVLDAASAAGLPVGIHLNLTMGIPISPPAEIPALITPQGIFMKRQQWELPLPVEQVRLELTRQVQRVRELGWQPSHLDSHHHIHLYPEVFTVIVELARELRLPVRAVNAEMRQTLRDAGIAIPDDFSMRFYGENATVDTLIELVDACPGGVLEIMTHPGHVTADLLSSYREERERELAALTSPRWQRYLAETGIKLIGFSALNP